MSLLFGAWYIYYDEDGVTPYYHNNETQETTWTKPTQPVAGMTTTPVVVAPNPTPVSENTGLQQKYRIKVEDDPPSNQGEEVEKKVEVKPEEPKKPDMHSALREMLARRQSGTGMSLKKDDNVTKSQQTSPLVGIQSTGQVLPLDQKSQPQSMAQKRQSMGNVLQSMPQPSPTKTSPNSRPKSIHERFNQEVVTQPDGLKKDIPVTPTKDDYETQSTPTTPGTTLLKKDFDVPQGHQRTSSFIKEDWQEFVDKKTGKAYYFNTKTKKTQWTKPEGMGEGQPQSVPGTPTHKRTESVSIPVQQIEGTLSGICIPLPKVTSQGKSSVVISGKNTLVTYSRDFFKTKSNSSSGFFKSKVSDTSDPLSFQKTAPKSAYHSYTSEEEKLVLPYYDLIMQFTAVPNSDLLTKILSFGMNNINFRNELFIYVVKQVSGNPTALHALRGLRMMTAMIATFLPSKRELTEAIYLFVQEYTKNSDSQVVAVAQVCEKRLACKMLSGVRKTLPSVDVLKEILQGTAPLPMFGVLLEEYVEWQKKAFPSVTNVMILDILIQHLYKINAFTSEGLFRLTGEASNVEAIMDQFSLGKFGLETKDPHVITSVLKNWLRELAEPLVPADFYEACIAASDSKEKCVAVVAKFPQLNQSVILQLVQFLASILTEDFFKHTKMNIENISVVFAPNLLRNPNSSDQRLMMLNSAWEAKFVRQLIESAQGV